VERTRYCSRCLTTFEEDVETCPNLGCGAPRAEKGWGTLLDGGDTLDRTYGVDQRIAIGGAGVTYLAQELSDAGERIGPKLAIKVLYAQRDQGAFLRRLANEAQILLELDHPNIVKIMGFVQRKGHSPYLVTQFEQGGSLLDHLRRHGELPVRIVAGIGVQLCDALHVAHGAGVVHRDLKPENILLSATTKYDQVPQVRLTDFGIAKIFGGVGERLTRLGSFVGTPQYAAPEQFEGVAPTAATDVFAMAGVLRFCLTLRPHLANPDMAHPEDVLQSLLKHLPPLLEGEDQDTRAFNFFLRSAMAIDPDERPDLPTARDILQRIAEGLDLPTLPRMIAPTPIEDDTSTFVMPKSRPKVTDELDTLEGILSTDGDRPRVGTARHPQDPPAESPVRMEPMLQTTPSQPHSGLTEPPPKGVDEDGAEAAPKKSSRGGCVLLGVALLFGCAGISAPAVVWLVAPWRLPAVVLDLLPAASSPTGEDRQVLVSSILDQQQAIRRGCKGDDRVRVTIVVEPTGKLRKATPEIFREEQRGLALCIALNLRQLTFDRRARTPAILSLEL